MTLLGPGLILASSSPRRKAILRRMGVPFRVVPPSGVRERRRKGEGPASLVRRLSLEKALWVRERHPLDWVLGADTVVVCGKRVFGKPRDRKEAGRMLSALQRSPHWVYTGISLVGPSWKGSAVEKAKVSFKPVPRDVLGKYLSSREPYDKAGAYNILGWAKDWVRKREGELHTVLGLPSRRVRRFLREGPGLKLRVGRGRS